MKKEQVMKTLRAYSMVIVLVVIAVLFHLLTNGLIFTAMNLTNIILQNSYVVLLILGMLPVILTGNVDLSVGSVLAFVGAIAAPSCRKRRSCDLTRASTSTGLKGFVM